ncbi:MAG: ATPase domain-containing protein [archaeon]
MQRKKFYIEQLDAALKGGIPCNNIVLLAGGAGAGKTTLCMEFLCNGINKDKEKGIIFTLNEPDMKLVSFFEKYSFFDKKYIESGYLNIIDLRTVLIKKKDNKYTTAEPYEILNFIAEQFSEIKPKRIVIDSLSALCSQFEDEATVRHFLFELGNLLIVHSATSILISETHPEKRNYSNFGVEEFISDGIIYMTLTERNNKLIKTLQIVKMRGTEHSEEQFLLNVSDNGISLLKMIDKNA